MLTMPLSMSQIGSVIWLRLVRSSSTERSVSWRQASISSSDLVGK